VCVVLIIHLTNINLDWRKYNLKKLDPLYTEHSVKCGVSECRNKEDVASRIKKGNGAFVQLYPVWRIHNISKGVKIRIFSTNVKSLLLYACETWKTTNQITRRLQTFINKCLRQVMSIKWTNKITNKELWRITKQKPIEIQVKRRK
jgi:hypothetical protein